MNRLSSILCCTIFLGAALGAVVGCQRQLPPPNIATAPPRPDCRSVLDNDLETSRPIAIPDNPGVNLTGRRLATWPQPGLRPTGKWAGIVARDAGDNPAKKPRLLSALSPGDTGCLFFIDRADGPPLGRHAEAFVQKSDNSAPVRLKAALICYHLIEHGDPPPTYESAADNCPMGTTAVGSIALTDRFDGIRVPLHFPVEADGFEAALRRQLAAFLPTLRGTALDDIVKLLVAPGPWFPCELNGCCRAF